MPIRTTATLVSEIIELDEDIVGTPPNLDQFILPASLLVDRVEAGADSSVTDTVLEVVERWLSAHFYAIRDPRTTEERAGPVSERYQSKVDLNLNVTHYGQMAMSLDPSGILRSINNGRRKSSVTWLGTEL